MGLQISCMISYGTDMEGGVINVALECEVLKQHRYKAKRGVRSAYASVF